MRKKNYITMSDKYPSLSPYVYCADNPVKLIDPNGNEWVNAYDAIIANGQGSISNRQWSRILKRKQQIDEYINDIKTNDKFLYDYVDNLKVINEKHKSVNVKVTVEFGTKSAKEDARTEYKNKMITQCYTLNLFL